MAVGVGEGVWGVAMKYGCACLFVCLCVLMCFTGCLIQLKEVVSTTDLAESLRRWTSMEIMSPR